MGRKKLTSTNGRWANIIVKEENDRISYYYLDSKGALINKFKSKKHDRTADHNLYLANSSSDNPFSLSQFFNSQHNSIRGIDNGIQFNFSHDQSEDSSSSSIPSSPQSLFPFDSSDFNDSDFPFMPFPDDDDGYSF